MAPEAKRMSDIRPLLEAISIAEPMGLGEAVQEVWRQYIHADLGQVLRNYRWVYEYWYTFGEPRPGDLQKLDLLIFVLNLIHEAEQKYYTEGDDEQVVL